MQRYVGLAKSGRLGQAHEVVVEQCPLPAVCGYLCQCPCEASCLRAEHDRPVDIRWIKRALAEAALAEGKPIARRHLRGTLKVAVIGGGPTGLSAVRSLLNASYQVTLFERDAELGGLLRRHVPPFRLPKHALDGDIRAIVASTDGLEIRTGESIELSARSLVGLLESGYAAVLVAAGASGEIRSLRGLSDHEGVVSPFELLGSEPATASAAVVVGPSQAGVASARILARQGCSVTLVSEHEVGLWPADEEDLSAAQSEGVVLRGGFCSPRVEASQGRFCALKGRDSITSEELRLDGELLVTDGVRCPDLPAGTLELTALGTIRTDPHTLMTDQTGVFAAGEVATGPKTAVEAIAAGKRAAVMMDRFLKGEPLQAEAAGQASLHFADSVVLDRAKEQLPGSVDPEPAWRRELTPLAAAQAAARCLRCGPCRECAHCDPGCCYERFVSEEGQVYRAATGAPGTLLAASVESELCTGCGLCEVACPHHAVVVRFQVGGAATASVDRPGCRGCGACAAACPFGAIDLRPAQFGWGSLRQAISSLFARVKTTKESHGD